MALTIHQKPLYDIVHSGEKIIFTAKDVSAATSFVKVKYIARVYVAKLASDLGTSSSLSATSLVATLKTNPNSSGVGIFDLSPILDNYVHPDYEGGGAYSFATPTVFSTYKTVGSNISPHPLHLIDNFASNQNSAIFFRVVFNMEYATALTNPVEETSSYKTTDDYLLFNGILDNEDILKESNGDYGYNLSYNNLILNDAQAKFLTNAPTKQYIRENDFMTLGFFNMLYPGSTGGVPTDYTSGTASATGPAVKYVKIQYYYNGTTTGSAINTNVSSGSIYQAWQSDSVTKLQYFGCGTANQIGDGSSLPANWDYYTVIAYDDSDAACSQTYSFYKQTDDCKGYETIRLAWLNKFGVWDYYNFTKLSKRTFSKQSVTFTKQDGTWNKDKFEISGYKGGSRVYKNSAKEKLTINTDYITEEEGVWLEELFLSNDVFIINQSSTDYTNQGLIRKYIDPVIISGEEHIRKTKANDSLIQYTFEISKSKDRKIHRS